MAAASNSELPPASPAQEMCQLCQLPVHSAARTAHESGLHHQAARQVAAVALDRWRAHMATDDALRETLPRNHEPLDVDNVIFCDICMEAVPTASYPGHVAAKAHLIPALDGQVFEELVRAYIDEEDLKLLEASKNEDIDDESQTKKTDATTTYECHTCALTLPSVFKSEHERSVHHKTRVALAAAAARRTSAFLHDRTPVSVPGKRNIKMTELLKLYTGVDLTKKTEEVIEKEIQVEDKASQSEVKKRLTAKQYFTDIMPNLEYTGVLYTLIIDDTEYVTIKNTNGTYMRVHVAKFNGIYCKSGDCDLQCRVCNGYSQFGFSSELGYDKLHVMSLGHIRHVLTPIDNIHGIRKVDNGSHCVLCNLFLPDHNVDNHVFNDLHHTANLSEALKLGRNFKKSKDDLKIIIYSAPPVDKSKFMRYPVRNYDSVLPWINYQQNDAFGRVNVVMPESDVPKPPVQSLFGANNSQIASTHFGANSHTGAFGGAPATSAKFGAGTAGTGFNTNAPSNTFGTQPSGFGGSTSFGASSTNTGGTFAAKPASGSVFDASTGAFGTSTASPGLNTNPSNTGALFGAKPASINLFGASNASTAAFGTKSAATGFNAIPANTNAFGTDSANSGNNVPDENGTTVGTTNSGTTFSGPPKTGTIFGA